MRVEFKPFPDAFFAPDSKVNCVGVDMFDEYNHVIGRVIDYEIRDGELVCIAEITDLRFGSLLL